ncbi:MAG TPA: hypothetical protein VE007_13555, partial [Thermoanaerobaculia bacterium]|nr:hypothetical protein [Thermoanaerobaculia bacterium]
MAIKVRALGGISALILGGLAGSVLLAQTPTPAGGSPTVTPAPAQAPAATTPAAGAKAEAPPLCTDCHEDQGKSFHGNPHERAWTGWGHGQKPASASPNAPCQNCHGEGALHMESAGENKTDIRVFRGRKSAEFCTTCHRESTSHASFKSGMHANSEAVNCTTCHSIHNPDKKSAHLNVKAPQALCQSCHPTHAATMREKPFTHRPVNGVMECTTC